MDALVQQLLDDWVLKSNEANEVDSDTVNQHSSSIQVDAEQVVLKEIPSRPTVKYVVECIKGPYMSKSCNETNKSQQSKKRRKLVQSLTKLKRIARLSATNRNTLIHYLKSSKWKNRTVNTSKS